MLAGILKVDDFNGYDSNILCPFVAPVSIESNQPCSVSDTLTLRRIAGDMRQQRWEIMARLYPAYRQAFLVHSCMHGHSRSFAVRPPQVDRLPNETPIVSESVSTTGGQRMGHLSIAITTDIPYYAYLPLDFISLHDESSQQYRKLHIVTGLSANVLQFWPGLTRDLVGTVTIYAGKKAKGYFFIDNDTKLGITYTDGILADPGQISLVEDCN